MLTQEFILEMKQKLLDHKAKLEEELASLRSHVELGSDEDANAEEVAQDEVSQDVMLRIKTDLKKIDKALEKIEEGTYGTDESGKEIGEDRLRALPWADTAI